MWTSLTVSLVYYCGERCGRPKANVSHLSTIQMLCTIATVVLLRLCDWPVYFRAQFISLVHTVVAYVVFKPPWKVSLCFAFSLTNTALIFFNYNSPSFQTALSLQSTEGHVQNARLILFPKNHVCMWWVTWCNLRTCAKINLRTDMGLAALVLSAEQC